MLERDYVQEGLTVSDGLPRLRLQAKSTQAARRMRRDPCRARISMHADAAARASRMRLETPAPPPPSSTEGRVYPPRLEIQA